MFEKHANYDKYCVAYNIHCKKYTPMVYTYNIITPASKYLIYFYYKLGVRPNLVTIVSLVYMLFALILLEGSSSVQKIFGVVLLQIAYVNDYADGGLARLYNSSSKFGEYFDLIVDRVTGFIVYGWFYFKIMQLGNNVDDYVVVWGYLSIASILTLSFSMDIKKYIFPPKRVLGDIKNRAIKIGGRVLFNLVDTGIVYLLLSVSYIFDAGITHYILLSYGILSFIFLVAIIVLTHSSNKIK